MRYAAKPTFVAVVVAALSAGHVPAAPAAASLDVIKARQNTMERVRDAMKVLGMMVRGQAPFDPAAVEQHGGTIAEKLKAAAALFPKGSDQGSVETWAKPEIWAEASTFAKMLDEARSAAAAIRSVKDEAALPPALAALGNHCKGCHDQYRRAKE